MIKYIFFDMDGTLLNMGESAFEKEYLKRMVIFFEQRFPGHGKEIVKLVGAGAEAIKANQSDNTNEIVFWQTFEQLSGRSREEMEPLFLEYYATDFVHVGDDYVPDANMKEAISLLVQKGYQLVVATNPMVPQVANRTRLQWCQLDQVDWLEVTSFEHYSRCKPNVEFFQQICQRLQLNPKECMMIGNSLIDDLPATEIGMDFYFLKEENFDRAEENYTGQKGTRQDLLYLVKTLPVITK